MNRHFLWAACLVGCMLACVAGAAETTVLEAEDHVGRGAERYRDKRASEERCAGVLVVEDSGGTLFSARPDLPAGDYLATFWIEVTPADVIHDLAVHIRAGNAACTLGQIQFDAAPGYQPYRVAFFHPGGRAPLDLSAAGGSGFDGMRRVLSEEEKKKLGTDLLQAEILDKDEAGEPDALDELEEDKAIKNFKVYDHHVLCDRVEIEPLRLVPAAVASVDVDKVHYLPGEEVKGVAQLAGCAEGGKFRFVAEDVTEIDSAHEVFTREVELEPGAREKVEFSFKLGDREFGHALRCSLRAGDEVVHSGQEFFGVSRNVYRVGITANGGPQDTQKYTVERAAKTMRENKARYANYFERFAWAPCDYSNLAPKTELFWSGQTQYPGSITGMQNLLNEAHKVGVKGITYGKASAGGIEGFKTFQRHPDYFGHGPRGPWTEAFNVFYLERMLVDDYLLHAKPIDGGWQHWASLWTVYTNDDTVRFGAQAIMDGIEMFGWDGVRWDGHFVGNHKIFIDILKEKYPDFVHGYNIAFANPRSKMFMPPRSVEDFHTVAADHGLMMDESVRDWSHTNFSSGVMRPFYEAVCREADYIKRIGGLPLFITFDMASRQDRTFNVLCGLSAGQRYTYMTSPGDFQFGPLPKFLTRYSALVWDDTKRIAAPDEHVAVKAARGPKGVEPWWRYSTWLRELPDGRQQLLVNLLNPPRYPAFCNRVQTPPGTMHDVSVRVKTPAGARLLRAAHVSPDLALGHETLEAQADGDGQKVTVPRLRTWSIVMFEYADAPNPAFPLTTPVKDAAAIIEKQREQREKQQKEAAKKPAKPKPPPYYSNYAEVKNADLPLEAKLKKPEELRIERDGILDVHHARGAFSWLNPVDCAVGLLGGGRCSPSWVDLVGFKLRGGGCMDEFPDSYPALMQYDVLVLDNVNSFHLGGKRRVMAADFVRCGGGMLYFGGYFNLSCGADHNTYLAEFSPVRISKFKNVVRNDQGLKLKVEKPEFFGDMVDWSDPPCAFMVDTSELKEGVEVLASVGGHPAIVAHTYGKGRVITVLMNSHGDYPDTVTPYWEWPQWPRVIAACVRWLAEGHETKLARKEKVLKLDKTKITPDELMMEAFDLDDREFTAKLSQARHNVIDAEGALVLLETAVDNLDKIADTELLEDVVRRAAPFFDKKFAPIGEKLVKSDFPFLREAGYQVFGLAGDPKYRKPLEKGLREDTVVVVRQALLGIARMGDAESRPAVEAYLKKGSERLLAVTALMRMGDQGVLRRALPIYSDTLTRRIRLRSGRRSMHENLYGGVSFKLTPKQRKRMEAEYRRIKIVEAQVKSDLRLFADSLTDLSDAQLDMFFEFLSGCGNREVLPLAYRIFSRLPEEKAKAYRQGMKQAKLKELRMLAED